jgi:hypothetical protein
MAERSNAAVCKTAIRRFDPGSRVQLTTSVAQLDQSIGLRNRRLQVQILPGVPLSKLFPDRQAVRHLTVNEAIARSIRARGATRVSSSSGRAPVSKTEGSRFDSVLIRHSQPRRLSRREGCSARRRRATRTFVHERDDNEAMRPRSHLSRRVAQWQSIGLITRRSLDRSQPRLPISMRP